MHHMLVEKLIYSSHTRPDVAFAISVVSHFMHQPKEIYLQVTLLIMQYLKGTRWEILFERNRNVGLEAYICADFARLIGDRRTTTWFSAS